MLTVFEGADGVGKTTFIAQVDDKLKSFNIETLRSYLPGDTSLGNSIRKILFYSPTNTSTMAKGVGTSLFMADFIQTQVEVIIPNKSRVCLVDRWYYSEYAYAPFNGPDEYGIYDNIWRAYQTSEIIKPDLVVLLTANEDTIVKRLNNRSDAKQKGKVWGAAEKQLTVQNRYLEFLPEVVSPNRLEILDISSDYTIDVSERIANKIISLL